MYLRMCLLAPVVVFGYLSSCGFFFFVQLQFAAPLESQRVCPVLHAEMGRWVLLKSSFLACVHASEGAGTASLPPGRGESPGSLRGLC